jgi:rhodanese-related sulfurtransferase
MKKYSIILFLFAIWACQSSSSFKTVKIEEAKKYAENNTNAVWLDVRTPEEVSAGKITSALNIDFMASNFDEVIMGLDKSKTYLVYCKSGGRSAKASEKLVGKGFTIINMDGGFQAWSAAGYAVE